MAEIIASRLAGSSRAPLIGNTCMVMLRMDTARPSGCVLPITDTLCLFIDNEASRSSSTKPFRTESSFWYRASTISMLIDYELTCCNLRSSNYTLEQVISQVLTEPEIQSKILHRMKNETPRMLRQMLKQQRKRLFFPRVWPMSHCGSVLTWA